MRRTLCAAAALVLAGGLAATAQDPRPAQPAPKAVQPFPARPVTVTATKMAQLEEDYETLQAQREVRVAHVSAAEVSVQATLKTYDLINKLGATPQSEVLKAKYDFEMAKAQLKIREAELKEIEVKLKFAKKRLDDAKAAGVRPAPGVRPVEPKPVDPQPGAGEARELAAELKARLAQLQAEAEKQTAEAKRAEAELKVAEARLARILEIARSGIVAPEDVAAAEAKVVEATATVEKLNKERKALDEEIARLKAKLKEIEK